ncbi:cytochrome c [bacterium]|nr:MAG: cytochrome c [bacterium]
MKSFARPVAIGLSLISLAAAMSAAYAQKPAAKAVGYAPIEKVVKTRCVGCHQGTTPAGGVNLSSYAELTKAKYKGKPVVVAKNAKESILVKALHGKGVAKMPPGPGLSAAEIKAVEAWINAGAKK